MKPKRQLLIFCLLAVVSIGAFILVDTVGEFRRGLATVDTELVGHVHLLAEHAQLSFRGVDVLLSSVAGAFRRSPPRLLASDPSVHANLQHALNYVPQLSSLIIYDASGAELLWLGKSSAAELGLDGTDVIRRVSKDSIRHIGEPLVASESGQRFIPMSFRITSVEGEFYGVVVALLDAAHFYYFHREIDPEGGRRVAMYLAEGQVLTLFPAPEGDPDKDASKLDIIFNRLPGNSYVDPSPLDGSLRITAYQNLEDYPVGLAISITYRDFIENFYGMWLRRALLFLMLLVGIWICYKAISRSVDTAERLREQRMAMLQQQRRFERLAQEIIHNIPNGRLALLDPGRRYIFADGKAFSNYERLAPANILGKTTWDVHLPHVAEALDDLMAAALRGEETTLELEPTDGAVYEVTAVPLRDENEEISRVLLISQDITEFYHTRQTLEARNQELHEISVTDALLDISNRRALDMELQREWNRAQRQNEPLAVLMIDVDHFKIYNDTYGHAAGDVCLRQVADAVRQAVLRPGDMVARYGGEEIVVLLPSTDQVGAKEVADRIHQVLAEQEIPFPHSPIAEHVTLSIGVASVMPSEDEAPTSILHLADRALYRAKQTGRNRTVVYETEEAVLSD